MLKLTLLLLILLTAMSAERHERRFVYHAQAVGISGSTVPGMATCAIPSHGGICRSEAGPYSNGVVSFDRLNSGITGYEVNGHHVTQSMVTIHGLNIGGVVTAEQVSTYLASWHDGKRNRFTRTFEPIGLKVNGQPVNGPAKVDVPGFGTVYVGETLDFGNRQKFTGIRVDSPMMRLSVADVDNNGTPVPPE